MADELRRAIKGTEKVVTYQIDRNVNITNICRGGCKFCSFHVPHSMAHKGYITSMEQYDQKIEGLRVAGGDQLLLQGGMHPELGIEFYEGLFSELKRKNQWLRLHALGAPEIFDLAQRAGITPTEALHRLRKAGLDSLPGAGAEILDTEWRAKNCPGKCSAEEWLGVMEVAQGMGLLTTATMMYGYRDSAELRLKHLFKIRELQARTDGFSAFIAWPYRGRGKSVPSVSEYLRIVAISRLVLDNVANIQASWLTVGVGAAQVALHGGANDMGSILLEENVVRSAGVTMVMDEKKMCDTITAAGFTPQLRNQDYSLRTKDLRP